jgi:toxin ParE1/3/4
LADLLAINDYYLLQVSDRTAAKIIDSLESAFNSLAELNERGSVPKELLALIKQQASIAMLSLMMVT